MYLSCRHAKAGSTNTKNLLQPSTTHYTRSYVSEALLDCLSDNLQFNSLRHMYVKVSAHEERNQLVHGCSWQRLRDQCPSLEVAMLFQRVMTFSDHFRILCPEIPLSQVSENLNKV